jgi:DNA polymerase-1
VIWRNLRRAVREAHALGAEFRIRGNAVEITGIDRLPNNLRDALDLDLLWSYLGAEEDDDEALAFLESLNVEAVLVDSTKGAAAALTELAALGASRIGIDIETTPKPEYPERRPAILINIDNAVSARVKSKKDKVEKPAALDPHRGDVATLQLYGGGPRAFVFRGDAIAWVLATPWLKAQTLIAHNAPFELGFLRSYNLCIWCTLQAGGLAVGTGFAGEGRSLERVAGEVLGHSPPKALQISDWGAPHLSEGQVAYAASDAVLAFLLWPKLRAEFVSKGRGPAFLLQQKAIPAVVDLVSRGLRLDVEEHSRQGEQWSLRLAEARRDFLDVTGHAPLTNGNEIRAWMLRSAPADLLRGWPTTPRDNALSVKGKHLKRLLGTVPGIEQVLVMQSMQQLISNFGPKLVGFISPATGRIHASYNLAATKAGRFSASKPNLQQLPSTAAPDFRRCIIPAPGYVFVGCDWNQVEMRAAGWISRDRNLLAVYAADPVRDLHRETASAIARVPYDDVTSAQRQAAKAVNFGSIYGVGPVTLSEHAFDDYGILMTEAEAQQALDRFFAVNRGFNDWRWDHWRTVKASGQVVVPGSGRTVEAMREQDGRIRFAQASNIPIQGLAADMMLLALRLVYERLQGLDARLIVTMHDELLAEARESCVEQVRVILQEAMIEAFVTTLPGAPSHGVAEAVIGMNWLEVKEKR